ncbi:hypothetical protein [Micromonospora wenchangensis]|uniref:hypothetical protein n=1 Tax=Micromonospora wenchangensis TaxID=1185415 RepID=UPI0038301513
MPDPTTTYAWCFSHGRMHTFVPSAEYPDGAWCTAEWMPLDGDTEVAALADKHARYGDAQFIHHLPFEAQVQISEAWSARHDSMEGS